MNLGILLDVYAGGDGSGPNAPCPQCGPHGSHDSNTSILKGDKVKTKSEVTMFNLKTGNVDKMPPGSVMTVVNILPKIANADQMVSVVTKKHDAEYMALKDVELHKKLKDTFVADPVKEKDLPKYADKSFKPEKGDPEQKLDIQPVKKSQTIIQFETKDGASVTWVKSHEEPEHNPKTLSEISTTPHGQKGNFAQIDVVTGIQDRPGFSRVSRMYDTSNLPAHFQKGPGASVWVDSYIKKGAIKEVKIAEQNYAKYSWKTKGLMVFSYKNAAQAVGMLKTRYGIVTKLDRLRKKKPKEE